jgi:membrane protein YqaA with SNARE-associated domain
MHLLLDPTAWLIVIAFSVLGSIGNLALYQVGSQGVDAIRQRFPRIKEDQWLRVKSLYDKYGGWILLLSGIPVLGSLLTTAAGAFGVPRPLFLLLVTIGKMLRNWVLAILIYGTYNYFRG